MCNQSHVYTCNINILAFEHDENLRFGEFQLPLLLIDKLCTTVNPIEMARVTGVPINFLIMRGQQIKVLSQLYRTANPKGLVNPYLPYDRDRSAGQNKSGYEGATVSEPKRGSTRHPSPRSTSRRPARPS